MDKQKLLFVDDDLAVLSAYQRMLRPCGYRCEFEADPRQVLQQIDLSDVGVLFVDHRMPELTGVELLHSLHGRFPMMKRVLISGNVEMAKSVMDQSINLDAVLAKPCSKMALLSCINKLLQQQ